MISLGIMLYEHTIRIKSLEGLASLLNRPLHGRDGRYDKILYHDMTNFISR